MIKDQAVRDQALDINTSFIVQAPAGSGKTELLIQRFLALLGRVQKNPEEILAITFTRKAAAEMRKRILLALKNAEENAIPPQASHTHTTWQLAKAVLLRNQTHQWQLLENPNRLCITTIDSFCGQLGTQEKMAENPELHYQQAARDFLASLEQDTEWSASLADLLLHLDNNHPQAENLFINMLANRDQWLPYLRGHTDLLRLRKQLENSLQQNIKSAEKKCLENIPDDLFQEIVKLLAFAEDNLNPSQSTKTTASSSQWQGIAKLLLTQKNEFRKSCDKRMGFPTHFPEMKKRMQALLNLLGENQAFRAYLQDILELPPPCYTEQQWHLIKGLVQLLPLLVGHLSLVFQEHNEVDFVEMVARANKALGELDNPSNLALHLDYRIRHILVDEFQDTSMSHYRVLEKLVMGWQPGDGRSLFLVGDPMQSIYRFRQAEVGLFLRARERGVGDLCLTPLTLSVNFRSTPGILNWLNQTFKKVLPVIDNMNNAAVSYAPAAAPEAHQNIDKDSVQLHTMTSQKNTATGERIAEIITQTWQNNPKASIAILVKSRSHLYDILPVLRSAGLNYQAIDIEPLSQCTIIQDLFALTRALTHLADRTAWLAILRAPWCGLKLVDIHVLANHNKDTFSPLWASLKQFEQLNISKDALERLKRIVPVLNAAIQERDRKPLVHWIKGTWYALGGPACAIDRADLEKSTAYFKLLQKFNQTSSTLDISVLKNRLEQLYAEPNPLADARLQVMTIHKAKGLEFDTVILPGLERQSPIDKNKLLVWMESPQETGKNQLILAPITSANAENTDTIYRYLRRQDNKKNYYETGRLLYVATTRAKSSLHLIANLTIKNSSAYSPPSGSLLEQLWPALKNDFMSAIQASEESDTIEDPVTPSPPSLPQTIRRLVAGWKMPENDI